MGSANRKVPSGWTVYHARDAGMPQFHGRAAGYSGDWHYQPDDGPAGEVWSNGYRTKREAIEACMDEAAARRLNLTTADDLFQRITDRRPDLHEDSPITVAECRDTMHELGMTRYENLTSEDLERIEAVLERRRVEASHG